MRILLLAIAALLTGCGTQSLHALHTPDATVFDEALVGAWRDDDGASRVAIEAGAGKSYAITYSNTGQDEPVTLRLTGWLVELGAARYVDLELAQPSRDELGRRFGMLALPVHLILRLDVVDQVMTLRLLDPDWLAERLDAEGAPARQQVGDIVVLTAPPEQTQAFLRAHGDDPQAYTSDKLVLRRDADRP